MKNGHILQTRMGLYNALVYMPYGVLFPFLALWFAAYGWGWRQISIIVGMSFTISIIFDLLVGMIADRTQAFRFIIFILSALSLVFWLLLPLYEDNFLWVLACYSLFRLFWVAIIPIVDNLGYSITKDHNGNWGILRSFGSVAFIITAQLTGYLIEGREDWASLMTNLVSIFMVLLILGTLILPKYNIVAEKHKNINPLKLLLAPSIGLFMCGVFFISKSHGQELFFGSVRWEKIGFSPSRISDLWTMRVGAEVIALIAFGYILRTQKILYTCKILMAIFLAALSVFFILKQLHFLPLASDIGNIAVTLTYGAAIVALSLILLRLIKTEITAEDLIILSAIAAIIRWVILAYTSNEFIVFIAESLHALTYGGFLIAGLAWIRYAVPDDLSTTAVGLFNGAAVLGYSVGAYLGGVLYVNWEEKSWLIEAGLAYVSLALFVLAFQFYKKQKA